MTKKELKAWRQLENALIRHNNKHLPEYRNRNTIVSVHRTTLATVLLGVRKLYPDLETYFMRQPSGYKG